VFLAVNYSPLNPDAWMIGLQRAVSTAMIAASASGVLPVGSSPS